MDLDLPMDHRNRKADACTLAGSPLLSAVENAFVLGAGFGTRLRPLTLVQPKPLIPLLNKPLISYAFDQLQAVGAKRFLVNTHHLAERYEEAFPSLSYQDTPITLVREEPEILDTGGGIANIASEVQGDSFWVFNGDIFTDLPLAPAMSLHREKGHWVTLLLRSSGPNPNVNWSPETGLVSDLRNARNTNGTALYQFTGIYLVHPAFLRYLKPEPESVVPAFLRLIEEENALGGALIDEGRWWDLGSRDAYLDATHALLSSPGDFQPGPRIHPTAHLADSAKIDDSSVIGAHCRVGDEVTLESSILWPHAQIHPGASLSRCILTGKHHPIIGEHRDTDFEDPLDQQTLLELTHRKLPNLSGIDFKAERIARGGSDRQYFRLRPAIQSLIFCQYEERTPEDSRFARHTDFLGEQGVPVPRIFARDIEARRLWIEDLGSQDLWSFREADWNVIRRPLYEASILAVAKIHQLREKTAPADDLPPLGPEFDEAMYLWEQDYFFDNFVGNFSEVSAADAEMIRHSPALARLREDLAQRERCLIHRDFQSQNIMIRDGVPVFIDYQGLRFGLGEYDLASLIYDPYVPMNEEQREDLIRFCEGLYPVSDLREMLYRCAAQRLMQALGAYGYLGLVKKKPSFLNHIRPAVRNLQAVAVESGLLPILAPLLRLNESQL